MFSTEMNEEFAVRKRETRRKVLKCAGAVLALGVVAALAVFFVWQSSQPTEEDLSSIGFYDPVNFGEEGSDKSLLVVQEDGLFGYANRDGAIVIPCQFEAAYPFHEGLAAAKKKNRWGYIDPSGKTVIPFRYYNALGFHDGRAFVSHRVRYAHLIDEEKHVTENALLLTAYALIDRTGKMIGDIGYYIAIGYHDRIYAAQGNRFSAYFDTTGNLLLEKEHESTGVFPIVDLNGDGRYEFAFHYFNGALAKVGFNSGDYGAYFMDRQGNRVIGDFLNARDFSEGLAAVQPGDPKYSINTDIKPFAPWGYIDTEGQTVIAPAYAEAFPFSEGLAVVKKQDGQWAVIDTSGREVAVEGTIEGAEAFHEGMCAVCIEWHSGMAKRERSERWGSSSFIWGFMGATGKLAVPCQYDRVSDFNGGIAEVRIGEKIGYIDKSGKYVWEPK